MKARRPEPAEIEFKNMRFLIMDRPTDATMEKFIEVCTYYYIINCVNYFWSLTLDNYCCTCTLKAKACITSCIKINMCFKYFQHEYFN